MCTSRVLQQRHWRFAVPSHPTVVGGAHVCGGRPEALEWLQVGGRQGFRSRMASTPGPTAHNTMAPGRCRNLLFLSSNDAQHPLLHTCASGQHAAKLSWSQPCKCDSSNFHVHTCNSFPITQNNIPSAGRREGRGGQVHVAERRGVSRRLGRRLHERPWHSAGTRRFRLHRCGSPSLLHAPSMLHLRNCADACAWLSDDDTWLVWRHR